MPPRLAMLHGWAFGPSVWDRLLPLLPASARTQCWSLPGYCAAAAGFVVDGDLPADEPTVCIGWSLGGMLLASIAATRPTPLRALVLVGVNARFLSSSDWPHGIEPGALHELQDDLATEPAVALKRFAMLCARSPLHGRSTLRTLHGCLEATALPELPVLMSGLEQLRSLDLRAAFARISIPMLLIAGDADPLVPIAAAQAIQALNTNITTHTIAGAGHAPFLSHPREFVQAIEPFIS